MSTTATSGPAPHGPHRLGPPGPAAPTTTSTTGKPLHFLPTPPHMPWSSFWVIGLAFPFLLALLVANRRLKASEVVTGGSGRVVGIVGRMGSGKSYMAVRMALRRMKRGANVVTNFTMNLDPDRERVHELRAEGMKPKAIAAELDIPVKRVKVLDGITGTWRMFRGWEQFATLENAVVIIDEAHLYAPSNKSMVFPDVARFKMSQARKFHLDVYWITQHENRVNSILKDLTNMMFVCRSWMTAAWFTVIGYEPEQMRRKGKHLERQMYRMNTAVADLYNTLEVLQADDHLMKSKAMQDAHRVAVDYNARVSGVTTAVATEDDDADAIGYGASDISTSSPVVTNQRCEHERAKHSKAGTCRTCYPPPPKPPRPRPRIRAGKVIGTHA